MDSENDLFFSQLSEMTSDRFWRQFIAKQFSTRATSETTTKMDSERLLFANSAFFDAKQHPTLTDQVFLCREIAKQLVSDKQNAKSKGREMFEKRQQKSMQWITASTEDDDDGAGVADDDSHANTISEGPPNLRLVLDPRHVQDLSSLDFEPNEAEMAKEERRTRDLCEGIFADLTSPDTKTKGNVLFALRQQKSDEWIVVPDDTMDDTLAVVPDDVRPTEPLKPPAPCTPFWPRFRDFNARAKPFRRIE
ncbi:uncharacterized protein LOC128964351 [Oppia nitens]|uniref:uncharacterized protein LOC128964351 n=1 Tax=Oppia nitens TaxID=1686743 RepID=UPI0023DAE6DF|nr:uncharacterized protein LOC128964351 [Oppia nitens]